MCDVVEADRASGHRSEAPEDLVDEREVFEQREHASVGQDVIVRAEAEHVLLGAGAVVR